MSTPPRLAVSHHVVLREVAGGVERVLLGEVLFDPRDFSPPLDPDGDGVYHFTTINVGPGVIVKLKAVPLGLQPVVWLAEGDVVINGVLDLNGEDGHSEGVTTLNTAAIGGAGGHEEGRGARAGLSATPGLGPGGGVAALRGGGAGHVNLGQKVRPSPAGPTPICAATCASGWSAGSGFLSGVIAASCAPIVRISG